VIEEQQAVALREDGTERSLITATNLPACVVEPACWHLVGRPTGRVRPVVGRCRRLVRIRPVTRFGLALNNRGCLSGNVVCNLPAAAPAPAARGSVGRAHVNDHHANDGTQKKKELLHYDTLSIKGTRAHPPTQAASRWSNCFHNLKGHSPDYRPPRIFQPASWKPPVGIRFIEPRFDR
jgi:hypothetical protein